MHSSKLSELRQDLLECPSWSSICRYVRMDLCLLCLLFWLNYLFLCVCVYMYIVHVWSGWAASSSEFRVKDRIAFAKIAKPRLLDCLTVGLVSKVFDRSDISLVPTHNIVEGLQADLVACRAIYRVIGVQPQYWSWTEQLTSHWHFFCKKLHRDKPCQTDSHGHNLPETEEQAWGFLLLIFVYFLASSQFGSEQLWEATQHNIHQAFLPSFSGNLASSIAHALTSSPPVSGANLLMWCLIDFTRASTR